MAIDGQKTMSKTQHYRKVTKPLLERKRRARMNHYLDELKELIVETMEANGEHITKLEKADILELTVEYLRSKKSNEIASINTTTAHSVGGILIGNGNYHGNEMMNTEKFRAGYTQAAYEVSKIFSSIPGVNVKFGSRLMKHLAYQLKDLQYPSVVDGDNSRMTINNSLVHQNNIHHQQEEQQQQQNLPTANEVWRPW